MVNGYKQLRLETALKLLNGLGFKYDIKLNSKHNVMILNNNIIN